MSAPGDRSALAAVRTFVAVGLALRLLLYALKFPLWGDETFVSANFLDKGWMGLTGHLLANQVASILFLWAEYGAYLTLGMSEWALRLLPFLAGCSALFLFARFALAEVGPKAAAFAVAIVAVSWAPIRTTALLKPYSLDLLAAVAWLSLAMTWKRDLPRRGPAIALLLLGPLSMFFSYPAIFVAGGVGLALAPALLKRKDFAGLFLLTCVVGLSAAAFAGHYLLVGRNQASQGTQALLNSAWDVAFPPSEWHRWPLWLLNVHSGQMLAYPWGDFHGGSTATLILCSLGAMRLKRDGRRTLLAVLLAPATLNLLAAVLGKYPYGGGTRISQHLAPAICLLAGVGIADLVGRLRHAASRVRWTNRIQQVLYCNAAAIAGLALYQPFRHQEEQWLSSFTRELATHVESGDEVVVATGREFNGPLLYWHLEANGVHARWEGQWNPVPPASNRVWVVDYQLSFEGKPRPAVARTASGAPKEWSVTPVAAYFLPNRRRDRDPPPRIDVYVATPPHLPPADRPWAGWPSRW